GAGTALDYVWRKQRVTHRDVKPANILVGIDESDGAPQIESVKLADFGIAKAAGESTSLTSTGMTIGTMQYISPEAIEGEEVDNRSDTYSLGCTA
ncbi:protein kinase domain-containing protein, partial [Mycobacteroides abscessus]